MPTEDTDKRVVADDAEAESVPADSAAAESGKSPQPKEIGGRKGPDPTRYGDWEKSGRCIDF